MGKNQHVVKHNGGWAVKGEGNTKVTFVQPTQKSAIQLAIKIAKHQKSEVVIHGRDGKILDKDSYGNDPVSSKDMKH